MMRWHIFAALLTLLAWRMAHAGLVCPEGQQPWLRADGSQMCSKCNQDRTVHGFVPLPAGCTVDDQGVVWDVDDHSRFVGELRTLRSFQSMMSAEYTKLQTAAEILDTNLEACVEELAATAPNSSDFSWSAFGGGILVGTLATGVVVTAILIAR